MAEGKVKSAKARVHQPPAGTGGLDGQFHVYVFDVFNQTFLGNRRSWDTVEKAVSYQRHEQERIYAEQEADPAMFDLPFISADPELVARIGRDPAYREALAKELTAEARQRARKR
jgi:hypothetical protein